MPLRAILLALVLAAPAAAEPEEFDSLDGDGDGVLTRADLVAELGEAAADRTLARWDDDGDGWLGRDEAPRVPPDAEDLAHPRLPTIAASPPRMRPGAESERRHRTG